MIYDYADKASAHHRAYLEEASKALNSVLKPPTVLKFYDAELTVTPSVIYYSGPQGNAWAKIASLAKHLDKKIVFCDVVKGEV